MTQSEKNLLRGLICGPHCDQRVLHAPGDCDTCDDFPLLQKARQVWGIAFTGQPTSREAPQPCPSDAARGIGKAHAWHGNTPTATLVGGQHLCNVHPRSECEAPCPVHSPSSHHMRDWDQHWRDDRCIMERVCPHGIGHPDPDCRAAQEHPTHGCDGCCEPSDSPEELAGYGG